MGLWGSFLFTATQECRKMSSRKWTGTGDQWLQCRRVSWEGPRDHAKLCPGASILTRGPQRCMTNLSHLGPMLQACACHVPHAGHHDGLRQSLVLSEHCLHSGGSGVLSRSNISDTLLGHNFPEELLRKGDSSGVATSQQSRAEVTGGAAAGECPVWKWPEVAAIRRCPLGSH